MKLLLSTHNRGKVREMKELLSATDIAVTALDDLDSLYEIEETGDTFEENAVLKAEGYGSKYGLVCLADDSGLEVDALGGRPGVYSSRYADTDRERCRRLLEEMRDKEDRTARFVCCACLYSPEPAVIAELRGCPAAEGAVFYPDDPCIVTVRATLEGEIAREERGGGGFGFDPVMYLPSQGRHLAELSAAEKNAISHRGKAVRKMIELITYIKR
ncbi:MAG: non-canonical purine NTP pyrophosphatase [Abditibacteriota bacterium]|nr:non-canonical purine NTP pyrophosphatase [Abditibacteriota bacterium]